MPLTMIFHRLRHEWRLLVFLLVTVCLVTGFFALGPLYVRSVVEEALRVQLNTSADQYTVTVANADPIKQDATPILDQHLGTYTVRFDTSTRTDTVVCG